MRVTTRPSLLVPVLMLFAQVPAGAQDRLDRLPSGCPVPTADLEWLKQRLLTLASQNDPNSIAGLLRRAVTPGAPPACPVLTVDDDLDFALAELIEFTVEVGNPVLELGVFRGVRGAVLMQPAEGRAPRPIPLAALAAAVEHGRTEHGRGHALWTLFRLAEHDEARGYLLAQARAEGGPPAWPDLPADLVDQLYLTQFEQHADVRAELEREPSLIRDRVARCLVENRDMPRRAGPFQPTLLSHCGR
jgi:hypothetical protein